MLIHLCFQMELTDRRTTLCQTKDTIAMRPSIEMSLPKEDNLLIQCLKQIQKPQIPNRLTNQKKVPQMQHMIFTDDYLLN